MSKFFLELREVTKRYGDHLAVDAASLHIPQGAIYGLLGPNGAGKTSIIRMITGITAPDSGSILFDGHTLREGDSAETGYMPEERGLYKKMKVREQISYLLSLKGLPRKRAKSVAIEWLDKLSLGDWADKKTAELSKGMQQKVQFIATVAHEPRLLILDEPFSGLDPINTRVIEQEIFRLRDQGTTIIFSTHRMEQVEELCNYIALINHGKVILEDEITAVRKQFQKDLYRLKFAGDASSLATLKGVTISEQTDRQAMLMLEEGVQIKDILRQLLESPIEIIAFALHLPRLNEIFIELVSGDAQPSINPQPVS